MISEETISQIKDASRIEEVIADFITLKKDGADFIASCPFHNEKTPSFKVHRKGNFYKCFGCGKSGDSIQFLMDYKQINYSMAIEIPSNLGVSMNSLISNSCF